MHNVNGNQAFADVLARAKELSAVPVNMKTASSVETPISKDETPLDIVNMLKTAALTLGDGKSDNPNTYTPINEGVEKGPEPNTDPVAESKKSGELPSSIKTAVLSYLVMPTEKTAAMEGQARKALAIGLPLAAVGGAGIGYVGGRAVGEAKDRKNNQAYYEAGIYTAAQQLAKQIQAERGTNG